MEEVGQAAQLRAGELIIIVVVLIMWAGNGPSSSHCRTYRIKAVEAVLTKRFKASLVRFVCELSRASGARELINSTFPNAGA